MNEPTVMEGADQRSRWFDLVRGFGSPVLVVGVAWVVSLVASFVVEWGHWHASNPAAGPSQCDFFKAFFTPYLIAIGLAALIAPRRYRLAAIALTIVLVLVVTLDTFHTAVAPPVPLLAVPENALRKVREACSAAGG